MDCFPGRECRKFFLLFWCFHNLKEQTLPKLQPIIFDLQGPLLKSPNSQFLLCRKITKTSLCSFFCLFFPLHALLRRRRYTSCERPRYTWGILGQTVWCLRWLGLSSHQVLHHLSLLCQKGLVWQAMCFHSSLLQCAVMTEEGAMLMTLILAQNLQDALQHNHRSTDWFGLEGKDHPAPTPFEQGHLPQDKVFPSSLDLSASRDEESMPS